MNSSIIEVDWPCGECGYNLRTLARDAVCPECGFSVEKSLTMAPLALADSVWLWRVRIAMTALVVGVFGCYIFNEGERRLALLLGWWPFRGFLLAGWSSIGSLSWPLALLGAAFCLRRPEKASESPRWPGRRLFWIVLAHLCFLLFATGARMIGSGAWNPVYSFAWETEPTFFVFEIWLIFRIVETLAARIPGKPMLAESPIVRRMFCLLLLMQAIANFGLQVVSWHIWRQVMDPLLMPLSKYQLSFFFSILNATSLCLRPFWLYLPIFLLRFQIHLRRGCPRLFVDTRRSNDTPIPR